MFSSQQTLSSPLMDDSFSFSGGDGVRGGNVWSCNVCFAGFKLMSTLCWCGWCVPSIPGSRIAPPALAYPRKPPTILEVGVGNETLLILYYDFLFLFFIFFGEAGLSRPLTAPLPLACLVSIYGSPKKRRGEPLSYSFYYLFSSWLCKLVPWERVRGKGHGDRWVCPYFWSREGHEKSLWFKQSVYLVGLGGVDTYLPRERGKQIEGNGT